MFNLFKRKKEKQSIMYDGIRRIEVSIDRQQHKWADYLNGKTEKITRRIIIRWLIIFCLLFGGSSIFFIVETFNDKSEALHIDILSVPAFAISNDQEAPYMNIPVLSGTEFHNIQRFRKIMDSLRSTTNGKLKYDSICIARPGLMDSVALTEQIFLKQFKSK